MTENSASDISHPFSLLLFFSMWNYYTEPKKTKLYTHVCWERLMLVQVEKVHIFLKYFYGLQ